MATIPFSTILTQLPACDYDNCSRRSKRPCALCLYYLCDVHSHRGTPSGWVCDPYCL